MLLLFLTTAAAFGAVSVYSVEPLDVAHSARA
jgi:hypothetical protein